MKKLIYIILFTIFCNIHTSANEIFNMEISEPTIEEMAKFKADFLRKQLLLNKRQYNKVYKIFIKQSNKQIKYEEKLNNKTINDIKKVLNDAQLEKYNEMQNILKTYKRPKHFLKEKYRFENF